MLENPKNKVWLDADTIVATSDRQAAIRRCRELAEYNELRGEGRCTFCGVILNKSGKSYRCIFEREIEE